MPKPLSIEARLAMFPPVTCRLLARVQNPNGRVVAMTTAEIAAGARMTVPQVSAISQLDSWEKVPVGDMLRFSRACGVVLDDRAIVKRHKAYMRKIKGIPRYLINSPEWKTVLRPLAERWAQS